MDGMTEVQLGYLALQNSQDPKVKQFAQQMVTDHTKANKELKGIASGKGLAIPTLLDVQHRATVQSLQVKSGAAFDTAYISQMAAAHDRSIALFTAAQHFGDPDIATFASASLPTLQMHRQMVTSIQANNTM